jgi:hypothetical protein
MPHGRNLCSFTALFSKIDSLSLFAEKSEKEDRKRAKTE